MLKKLWKRQPWMFLGAILIVVASAGFATVRWTRSAPKIPTVEVKRGVFTETLTLRGELKALKSVILTAPLGAGGQSQILKLVRNGQRVKPGETVIQFDATKLQQGLAQKQSELKQAVSEIKQAEAEAREKEEKDVTDLMKARFDVETAKLEAQEQEILAKIDGEEKQLALADARQKLVQAEQQLKSDRANGAASVEDKKQNRDKALFDVQIAERRIAMMTVRAPIGGLVTVLPNLRFEGFSESAPPFKPGDQAWPGAGIVELPDLSTLRVDARVEEVDRGRLQAGTPVTVRVDAAPDREFTGKVVMISALAKVDFSGGWPPVRNFDMEVQLDQTDPRLRPGMSVTLRPIVDRVPGSLLIPPQAAFEKNGETLAYVLEGTRFEPRPIQIAKRTDQELAVASGLKAGQKVALKDPTVR